MPRRLPICKPEAVQSTHLDVKRGLPVQEAARCYGVGAAAGRAACSSVAAAGKGRGRSAAQHSGSSGAAQGQPAAGRHLLGCLSTRAAQLAFNLPVLQSPAMMLLQNAIPAEHCNSNATAVTVAAARELQVAG
jgi:hypothetical protein